MAERWGRCQGLWTNEHVTYVKRMFSTCAVSVVGFVCRPPDRMGPPRLCFFKSSIFVVFFVAPFRGFVSFAFAVRWRSLSAWLVFFVFVV